ncbi:MAG: GNAT family N-acetyltransferase [Desulfuromonas sp.]|nr:MAG: GNAT family N-acetyltransferase [Desulfuromonas sp.]
MQIRKARIADAKSIQNLLTGYATQGLMLSSSLAEIYDRIRAYHVAESDGRVVGVSVLKISWEDLAEVRSLAVGEEAKGHGLGRKLVEACLEEARSLGLKRVFALTYQVDFFRKLGFEEIDKAELPQKIWADCIKCVKFPDCDETALIYSIE